MTKEKMQNRAGLLRNICYLFMGLNFLLVVAALILLISNKTTPHFKIAYNPGNNGGNSFAFFSVGHTTGSATILQEKINFTCQLIFEVTLLEIVLFLAAKFFNCLTTGISPFKSEPLHYLTATSRWLFVYALLPMFVGPIINVLITGDFVFNLAFTPTLLLAIIVSLAVQIFHYGASLQHEVDETV